MDSLIEGISGRGREQAEVALVLGEPRGLALPQAADVICGLRVVERRGQNRLALAVG